MAVGQTNIGCSRAYAVCQLPSDRARAPLRRCSNEKHSAGFIDVRDYSRTQGGVVYRRPSDGLCRFLQSSRTSLIRSSTVSHSSGFDRDLGLYMSWPMQNKLAKRSRYVRSIIAILLMWPVAEKHRTQDCSLSSPSCVSRNPGRSWATTELSPRTRHVSGEHRRGFLRCSIMKKKKRKEKKEASNFLVSYCGWISMWGAA